VLVEVTAAASSAAAAKFGLSIMRCRAIEKDLVG
jgi:hypothetical protein